MSRRRIKVRRRDSAQPPLCLDPSRIRKRLAITSALFAVMILVTIAISKGMPGERWGPPLVVPVVLLTGASAMGVAHYSGWWLLLMSRPR